MDLKDAVRCQLKHLRETKKKLLKSIRRTETRQSPAQLPVHHTVAALLLQEFSQVQPALQYLKQQCPLFPELDDASAVEQRLHDLLLHKKAYLEEVLQHREHHANVRLRLWTAEYNIWQEVIKDNRKGITWYAEHFESHILKRLVAHRDVVPIRRYLEGWADPKKRKHMMQRFKHKWQLRFSSLPVQNAEEEESIKNKVSSPKKKRPQIHFQPYVSVPQIWGTETRPPKRNFLNL